MPTDQRGEMNNDIFVECLKNRPDYVYTQIVLVGADLKIINNSNLFGIHNFNVLNNYQNEFSKVKAYCSNEQFSQFSYGDFVAKSFLNLIFNKYPN